MRGAAIIFISVIALVFGDGVELNNNNCPKDITIERLLPHKNCNRFYHCVRGNLVVRKCASNLLFNIETQQCDWPERVDCGDRYVDTNDSQELIDDGGKEEDDNISINDTPDLAPIICAKKGSDGFLIAHEYCNRFYKCFNGLPVALRCPPNLLYNPRKEQCDWPENVNCGNRIIPDGDSEDIGSDSSVGGGGNDNSGSDGGNNDNSDGIHNVGNDNPSQAPAICAAEDSDGILVAHEYCNRFYKCFNGLPVALRCPPNLLYNPRKEQCDWPENVNCGNRIIPDGDSEDIGSDSSVGGGGNDNSGSDGGNNDNSDGIHNVGNDNPSQAPAICAAEDSDGILVAHEYCNRFYKCFNGLPVALRCPPNLLYNPRKEQCDWPENVNCGNRLIPDGDSEDIGSDSSGGGGGNDNSVSDGGNNDNSDGIHNVGNDNPSQAPAICAAEDSDGILVAHEYCNRFYKCFNGLPVALRCPPNLLYNPRKEQCDWPENVNCGNRLIPDGDSEDIGSDSSGGGGGNDNSVSDGGNNDNSDGIHNVGNDNPSQAPAICAAEDSDGILVAHEYCNRFYKCFNGLPVALRCPPNLLYNPRKEQCDWPENVNCGNRLIPDGDSEDISSDSSGGGGGNDNSVSDGGNNDNSDGIHNVGNDNPSQAPAICAAEDSDGILVAHEYCNRFYKCFNGLPVALRCPPNLLYNPRKEQCDWPENVNCGNRIIPDGDSEDIGSDSSVGGGGNDNSGSDGGNNDNSDGIHNVGNDNPSQAPAICAAEDSDGILVAHEYCNRFYKCFNGLPVALRCPPNLLYNPRKEQCDWPENVNCGNRIIPDSDSEDIGSDSSGGGGGNDNSGSDGGNNDNSDGIHNVGNDNPSQAPAICSAEDSDGILVAHEYCNRFYKCFNGLPVALRCPPNLLYNPRKEQCDWPENVNCGNRIIPDGDSEDIGSDSSGGGGGNDNNVSDGGNNDNSDGIHNVGNDNPSQAPAICAAEDSDGILVAHEYCNRFYKCFNRLPVALRCPPNLLYNPRKEQCDWPENVNCGNRIIPDGDSEDIGSDSSGGGGGNDNSVSDGGNNDNSDGIHNVGNDNPSQAPAICAAEDSDGILVAHEYCNRFYKCFNGLPVALHCPPNLLYNPRKEQCDWPENVNCGNRIIPDGDSEDIGSDSSGGGGGNDNSGSDGDSNVVNDNPSKAPAICGTEGSDGILIAHEYCNKFYKCSKGLPVALWCPRNLFYNPSREQCDWPVNVNCGNRKIKDQESGDNDENQINEDNETDDSEVPVICDVEGSDGIFTPHKNCNQFYICSDRKAIILTCPSNLLYDVDKRICDWSFNVDCKDRKLPI